DRSAGGSSSTRPSIRAEPRARYGLSVILESSEVIEEGAFTRHSMATINELADGSAIEAVTAGSHDGCSLKRLRRSFDESAWTSMKSARLIERVRTIRLCARRRGQTAFIALPYAATPEESLKRT